jgi:glycosyltransferase involved in cell wall biosynthesis
MHLLHVIHSVDRRHGGLAEGLRQLVAAGASLGQRHEVVTLDASGAACLADFPVPLHALGPAHLGYGWSPRLVPWLARHAQRFDAVIVHGLWQHIGLGTRRALRPLSVPYFVFCHGMLDPWFKREYPLKHLKKWLYWPWGEYRVLRDASAVLFTAQEEARLATQSFAIYRARAEVVGFGLERDASAGAVDAELFYTAFPATRGRRVLLFMSRLHPKKGCDLLIEAFAGAAASDASLHLAMAGPDQVGWQADLQALAQRLQVTDRITWCGMLTGELKWAALRAAEAFVLPSHQENFGVAVAEALAEGVPVLISDKVNIWREIVAADAGLVGPDTLEGTRSTLRRWLEQSPEQRRAMRAYASDCFERHFRMSGTAHRLAEVVALRGRAATRGPCAIHSLET